MRQIAEQEFNLYQHHTPIKNANEYLKLMQHFLIIQLIKQNSLCYKLTIAMRKNHEWKLFGKMSAANC